MAEESGFTSQLAQELGYKAEFSGREKLGSSIRYGYKYLSSEMWFIHDQVQLYLDALAYRHGLMSDEAAEALSVYLERVS